MFFLIAWILFGLVAGVIAKAIHPGEEPLGFFPTVFIGIAGSYVGGSLNWLFYGKDSLFKPSGIIASVVGAVIVCVLWRQYSIFVETNRKMRDDI